MKKKNPRQMAARRRRGARRLKKRGRRRPAKRCAKFTKSTLDLVHAIADLDLQGMRAALKAGGSPNAVVTSKYLPLTHYAVCMDAVDVLELLLTSGARIDSTATPMRYTALHHAVMTPSLSCAALLLTRDINVDAAIVPHGFTALHLACQGATIAGSISSLLVDMLLMAGADARRTCKGGRTPLHLAAECNSERDVADKLLEYGADPDARENQLGRTPLHFAARSNNVAVVDMLLASGADIDIVDSNGVTPLHLAARYSSMAACRALIREGASTTIIDSDGRSALCVATDFNRREAAALIREAAALPPDFGRLCKHPDLASAK